jgi:hypothetical protein
LHLRRHDYLAAAWKSICGRMPNADNIFFMLCCAHFLDYVLSCGADFFEWRKICRACMAMIAPMSCADVGWRLMRYAIGDSIGS